nr:hypothetical protein [uncultured Noviherbaspirillum sp.]
MKSVIIEGQFERYSNFTQSQGVSHVAFIEVGGSRYTDIVWSDYMGSFMEEAIGKHVRISLGKIGAKHVVGALEYNGKIEKESKKKMVGYNGIGTIGILSAILVCALILTYMTGGSPGGFFIGFFGGMAVLQWILMPMRLSRIADALDSLSRPAKAA